MSTKFFIHTVGRLLLLLAVLLPLRAQDAALSEKAKIEALIARVEKLDGAVFIRNGSDYDAKTAAKFLRGKWGRNESEIKTAADFIAKAATGSSTSGKPYLIRFKDGSQTECGVYLSAELKKLEQPR
jgi:hypothetical protein